MAIPLYLICSTGSSQDKATGMYSIFEVIDKLTLFELPKPTKAEQPGVILIERQKFVISSAWHIDTKSGEEYEEDFDFQVKVHMENGDIIMEQVEAFKFLGPETPIHRYTVNLQGPMPIKQSGILIVECRVRKAGQLSWKQQQTRIIVDRQKSD